jgi:hypothetical protein
MRAGVASHVLYAAWTIITTLFLTRATLAEEPQVVSPPGVTATSDAESDVSASDQSQATLPTGVSEESAREAAILLAAPLPEEGYSQRGKPWLGELRPAKPTDTYHYFKRGTDAFICVAVPPDAKISIGARLVRGWQEVLKVQITSVGDGWGLVLRFRVPSSLLMTDPYMLIVGQLAPQGERTVPYAILVGEKERHP